MRNTFKRIMQIAEDLSGIVLIIAACCLGLMSLYFSTGTYKWLLFEYYMTQPKLVLLNLLPFIVICVLVWFISNRTWVGFLCGSILCLLYSWVEYWKLLARNDPLYVEDLLLLDEALKMREGYAVFTKQMVLSVVLVIFGTAVFGFIFKGRINNKKVRIGMLLGTIIFSGILYGKVYMNDNIYYSFKVWDSVNVWFDNNKYISRGGIYPFIYSIKSAIKEPPEGYSEEIAKEYLLEYESDDIEEDKKVSVICVMYEAFADLSEETDLITGNDPYEQFHKLQEESYSGNLVTNVFAGGTVSTERCVLTGFLELMSFRRESWSYARYFAEQGYELNGSHAGFEPFYSRAVINQNLGFDEYYFIENYYSKLYEGIPTDSQILPEITRICMEDISESKPVFSFNVTYQNHGPYDGTKLLINNECIPKGVIADEYYYMANNYLNGIKDTCENMMNMVNSFRNIDSPVVLLFFGDHKPWMGEQSVGYDALGIDIISNTDESFYNQYETNYIIWANDAAKEVLEKDFVGEGPRISPCYLMNVLFEQCGWNGPSYMKLSNDVLEKLPVATTTGSFQENNELVTEEELSQNSIDALNKMRIAQFYLAHDAEGKLP